MALTDFGDIKFDYNSLPQKNASFIPFLILVDEIRISNTDHDTATALGLVTKPGRKPNELDVKKAILRKFFTLYQDGAESIRFLVENITTRTFEGEKAASYGTWRLRVDPNTPFYDKTVFNNHTITIHCTRKRGRLKLTRLSLQRVSKRPYPTEGILTGPVKLIESDNSSEYFFSKEDFSWLLKLPKRRKHLQDKLENWEEYLQTYLNIVKNKQVWIAYRNLERINETQARLQLSLKHFSKNFVKGIYAGDTLNVLEEKIPDDPSWHPTESDRDPVPLGQIAKGEKFRKYYGEKRIISQKEEWINVLIDLTDEYVISEESSNLESSNIQIRDLLANLPSKGLLLNSVFLDRLPFELQQKAITRLLRGQATNPHLEDFIFDVSEARTPYRAEKIDKNSLIQKNLNPGQFQALEIALNSPDLTLIQGPPGTGKTTLIAELCHQIALWGGKVLIASQANLAVDNALKRLANQRIIMPIRIGRRTTEEGHEFVEQNVVKRWFESVKNEVTKIVSQRDRLIKIIESFENSLEKLEESLADQHKYNKILIELKIDLSKLLKIHNELKNLNKLNNEKLRKKERIISQITSLLQKKQIPFRENFRIIEEFFPEMFNTIKQNINEIIQKSEIEFNLSNNPLEIGEILALIQEMQKNSKLIENKLSDLIVTIQQTKTIVSDEILEAKKKQQQIFNNMSSTTNSQVMDQLSKELSTINTKIKNLKEEYSSNVLGDAWQDDLSALRVQISLLINFSYLIQNNYLKLKLENLLKSLTPNINHMQIILTLQELHKHFQTFSFAIPMDYLNKIEQKLEKIQLEKKEIEQKILKNEIDLQKRDNEITNYENNIDTANHQLEKIKSTTQKNIQLISQLIPTKNELEQKFLLSANSLQLLRQYLMELQQQQQQELQNSHRWLNIQKEWINKIENSSNLEYEHLVSTYIDLANVVGATCTETGKYRFYGKSGREFDLVIIDEVSKATPPELLMPMLLGKQIVLVGDHQQLPPLFRMSKDELPIHEFEDDTEAHDLVKRFERLVTASYFQEMFEGADHLQKERLTIQYRMHSTIMRAINQFYPPKYQLIQGLAENDPKINNHFVIKGKSGNLSSLDSHLIWIDTTLKLIKGKTVRNIEEREEGKYTSRYNEYEVNVIKKILISLNKQIIELQERGEKPPTEIAIISFYAGQERRLRNMVKKLHSRKLISHIKYRIGTVDRFQGMERPIVIVSLVSSPQKGTPTTFVKEFRRINVAFSRAQALLLIVGSKTAFENVEVSIKYGKNEIHKRYSYAEIIRSVESCMQGNYYIRGHNIVE